MTTTTMTATVRPDFEALANIAGDFGKWCAWGYQDRGEGAKPAKVPHNGRRRLDSGNPDGWLSFDQARRAYEGGGFDGVGVLITGNGRPVVAFDIDSCLDDEGNVISNAAAVAALVEMGSCVEVSPSGNGLRAFVRGLKLDDCREKVGDIEVYDTFTGGRYVTVTGKAWGEVLRPIVSNQEAIEAFLLRFGFVRTGVTVGASPAASGGQFGGEDWPPVSDDDLLVLLKRNNKRGRITRLLAGDTTGHDGDSEARAALIGHVAYYSRDVAQVDRIMRGSGLMKPKLDDMRSGEKFSVWEIQRVLAGIDKTGGGSYWVDKAEREAGKAATSAAKQGLFAKLAENLVGGYQDLLGPKGLKKNISTFVELMYRDKLLTGAMSFDEFRQDPVKHPPFANITGGAASGQGPGSEVLTDTDIRAAMLHLAREYDINLKIQDALQVVKAWAEKTRRNPVRDRLQKLADQWDGVERLGSWLVDYMGAGAGVGGDEGLLRYLSAVGERWLMSAVARAFVPGCQVDLMLILEGPQGARKSSAVRVLALAITASCFLEGFDLAGLSKDTLLMLRGRLIVEWGELAGLSRHDAEVLKNFLSRRTDSYRAPYDALTRDWPRTAVFCATTNDSAYLRDVTGNRRYLPVRVGKIDLERLAADAEQLWGEAVRKYQAGGRWWIDDSGEDAGVAMVAAQEVAARMMPDAWAEIVEDFGRRLVSGQVLTTGSHQPAKASDALRMVDLMVLLFGAEDGNAGKRSAADESRLRAALRRAGWHCVQRGGYGRWCLTSDKRSELEAEVGIIPPIGGLKRGAQSKHNPK